MEKLRLRDLKPYFRSAYDTNGLLMLEFICLVPVLTNSEILVPFRVRHVVDKFVYNKNKFLLKKRLLIQLAKELNKIVIFYNVSSLIENDYNCVIEIIDKYNIPPRWKDKVLTIDVLRKIIAENEYLAR